MQTFIEILRLLGTVQASLVLSIVTIRFNLLKSFRSFFLIVGRGFCLSVESFIFLLFRFVFIFFEVIG